MEGMPAVAVVQLEHLRDRRPQWQSPRGRLAVEAVAGEQVVAIGIRGVVGADLVKRQRNGARDLVLVVAHAGGRRA